ncbi:MAG: DUF1648 domain-containing protein, partial [Microbacterium sp.]
MSADRRPRPDVRTDVDGRVRLRARRFVLVALVLPAVVVVAGLVALLLAAPALPDPVAVHWGADGRPDGFG